MLYLALVLVFGAHIVGCGRKKKRCSRCLLCRPSGHGPVRRRAKEGGGAQCLRIVAQGHNFVFDHILLLLEYLRVQLG